MTPWPAFRELPLRDIAGRMAGRSLIDPYRVVDGKAAVAAGLDYFTLGVPPARGSRHA